MAGGAGVTIAPPQLGNTDDVDDERCQQQHSNGPEEPLLGDCGFAEGTKPLGVLVDRRLSGPAVALQRLEVAERVQDHVAHQDQLR